MKIVNSYVARDFLITFLLTLSIFTFVMALGGVIKAIDLLSRGVEASLILTFFVNNIPYMLMFSTPMSVLASALLVFGHLSADGEITAMKASGLSLWQIASPVILLSVVLTIWCFYINADVAPRRSYARRVMLRSIGIQAPISLIEEGTWVRDFPNYVLYIGRKEGDRLDDVIVFETSADSGRRSVRAEYGIIRTDVAEHIIRVDLYNVRIEQPDEEFPRDPSKRHYIAAGYYPVELDTTALLKRGKPKKKLGDMTLAELIQNLRMGPELEPNLDYEGYRKLRASMVVEANMRITVSLSCFAFTLLAVPLGLKSRRRESSIGIGISLLLAFFFYFFIILAESLSNRPDLQPHLIMWIPVIAIEAVGFYLIYRNL